MAIVKNEIKDAFVLRIPMNGDKVESIVVFEGDGSGSHKFPHKLIQAYVNEYGDSILGLFPESTPLRYGDLEILLGRFARFQPSTVIEEGSEITVVKTGTLRNVIERGNFLHARL